MPDPRFPRRFRSDLRGRSKRTRRVRSQPGDCGAAAEAGEGSQGWIPTVTASTENSKGSDAESYHENLSHVGLRRKGRRDTADPARPATRRCRCSDLRTVPPTHPETHVCAEIRTPGGIRFLAACR